MAKITAAATSESTPSQSEMVDAYMQKLNQPMKKVAQLLREIILSAHKYVGEEIAWNAPSFYYTGSIQPFTPKEYKRFIVGLNFYKKDCIRIIFLTGSKLNDTTGFLTGDYADGRRLAHFYSEEDVLKNKLILKKMIKNWIDMVE
jgi:hypothetical protein